MQNRKSVIFLGILSILALGSAWAAVTIFEDPVTVFEDSIRARVVVHFRGQVAAGAFSVAGVDNVEVQQLPHSCLDAATLSAIRSSVSSAVGGVGAQSNRGQLAKAVRDAVKSVLAGYSCG
ncbi:MAG: hypothetical protein HY335_07285 [Deinococcus sp.]|nr:hypothetical protein [Deinococcus sp.]